MGKCGKTGYICGDECSVYTHHCAGVHVAETNYSHIVQLIGEYPVALDNKGRLRLPTALLRQLPVLPAGTQGEQEGYEFVVNRGFEKCLTLYPKSVWDSITAKLSRLNRFNDRNRMFVRSFYLGAYQVATDSADRILLQKHLMDYAGLSDEAILVAMDDRIEIWAPQQHLTLAELDSNAFADLANQVMGGGEEGVGGTDMASLEDLFGPGAP